MLRALDEQRGVEDGRDGRGGARPQLRGHLRVGPEVEGARGLVVVKGALRERPAHILEVVALADGEGVGEEDAQGGPLARRVEHRVHLGELRVDVLLHAAEHVRVGPDELPQPLRPRGGRGGRGQRRRVDAEEGGVAPLKVGAVDSRVRPRRGKEPVGGRLARAHLGRVARARHHRRADAEALDLHRPVRHVGAQNAPRRRPWPTRRDPREQRGAAADDRVGAGAAQREASLAADRQRLREVAHTAADDHLGGRL